MVGVAFRDKGTELTPYSALLYRSLRVEEQANGLANVQREKGNAIYDTTHRGRQVGEEVGIERAAML